MASNARVAYRKDIPFMGDADTERSLNSTVLREASMASVGKPSTAHACRGGRAMSSRVRPGRRTQLHRMGNAEATG